MNDAIRKFKLLAVAGLPIVAFALFLGCGFGKPDPLTSFCSYTGIDLSAEDVISITYQDDYGLNTDGESNHVIEVSESTYARIVEGDPPWDNESWQPGPVPDPILGNCLHFRDLKINPYQSDKILFAAQSLGGVNDPWYRGKVIVLDPENRKIMLTTWSN